ncbi:hypothetical protein SAMN05216349_10634 [Oribacterium sp. KHPX15]|uniref:hypothetical protein n=1 Tax=Oribacterium sp. KHPX15 TaxID=1855342 RepID=UPI000894EAE9|nr:hypothetical protein [Oribacterium sp. KHPX15]SEA17739.1 hypothetical protein SAMN05216349_10634 [Oribacterium sp. KHPX15]
MNLNDHLEDFNKEEQKVLDALISKMNNVLKDLDDRMKKYVAEAKNADISVNPDEYLAKLLAQNGKKDTEENRKKFLQARDELYHTRLLLRGESDYYGTDIEELKIGLHSCSINSDPCVVSWTMPLCRHYLLDNASTEYESIVKESLGKVYHTHYTLLVKNSVKLRFTHVVKAMNLYPGIFNDEELKMMKGKDFFSEEFLDEMINRFNPDEYDPESAAKIISDEFLQELLERRSSPEFKNIVFSIQKKQGEIIQAPYKRNMIVQGCAGSGKSMIMMHRLPILLYDNQTSISRKGLYIITPSQMYIQLTENMRDQLEISDINMGTLEQYYDVCIEKYLGHKAGEYGRINYTSKISSDNEAYVYSEECINDIKRYFSDHLDKEGVSLEKAYTDLNLQEKEQTLGTTYIQKINKRSSKLQSILSANNESLRIYFNGIKDALEALKLLDVALRYRKDGVIRELSKAISASEDEILQAQKEIEKLNEKDNEIAIKNRKITIENARKNILDLTERKITVENDTKYFDSLNNVSLKLTSVISPIKDLKDELSQNTISDIYNAINNIGMLIGGFYMVSWEISKIEDKYFTYVEPFSRAIDNAQKAIIVLQGLNAKYLEYEYYSKIKEENDNLVNELGNGVRNAYKTIMEKIGVKPNEDGSIRALRCSPYIYLQALYHFMGAPILKKEYLLAIDESQGIAPEEIRLLKNINGENVVFNLYGDIYQHIEGTKGIDSWDAYRDVIDFDMYEMNENYRNASQITEYCNNQFGMDMNAINTPGKGVHEMHDFDEFRLGMIDQLMDDQRAGLAAILVGSDAEARYLLGEFSVYEQKFHDMTDEDFSIHRTRWNIINIDDAKGLEFSSVIVLSGRMTRNQKYIAYTRALDDLYVYPEVIDVKDYEKKPRKKDDDKTTDDKEPVSNGDSTPNINVLSKTLPKHSAPKSVTNHEDSAVRKFFEDKGLEVIDNRDSGGRLWVIGEKSDIRDIVSSAISRFGISGKYASNKESRNRNGWYTKSDK